MKSHLALRFVRCAVAPLLAAALGVFIGGVIDIRGAAATSPTSAVGTSGRPMDVDEAEAGAILGRKLPVPALPHGMVRTALTADPRDPSRPDAIRFIRQSFAVQGRNVALLTLLRAGGIESLDAAGVDSVMQDGIERRITTKWLPDGTMNVTYLWAADRVVFVLNVNLVLGIDRSIADALAVSVK